jgi:hypothetical protein
MPDDFCGKRIKQDTVNGLQSQLRKVRTGSEKADAFAPYALRLLPFGFRLDYHALSKIIYRSCYE